MQEVKYEWIAEDFDLYAAGNGALEGLEHRGYEITATAIGFKGTGQWGAMVPYVIVVAKKPVEVK